MGPKAGEYDPVKAVIKAPSRTANSAGEQVVSYSTAFSRYIRFMRFSGREGTTAKQVISATQVNIRMRRDSNTLSITPDYRISHQGVDYGIVSINPIPAYFDEIELTLDSVR